MNSFMFKIKIPPTPTGTLRRPIQRWYSAIPDGIIPASKQRFVPDSGTYPKGFKVSGTHVGVKASNTRFPDLAIIVSDSPCEAAGVFTQNKFQAAPVTVCRDALKHRGNSIRGVVVNSGCANAVTGEGGLADAREMAKVLQDSLSIKETELSTLVMSTGVIGQRLPIKKILDGIKQVGSSGLSEDHDSWLTTAKAICTTDTFPKLLSTTFELPSAPKVTYSLAGMTKGAGMIHPNMATLLGILATDAPIPQSILKEVLKKATDRSFNCISVDGDSSTNDSLVILANGAAGGPIMKTDSEDHKVFAKVLTSFTQKLSQLIVRDGEGATKFVRIRVRNAQSEEAAKSIASTVARSPLVKTALYGRDANWGRILCAVGYAPNLSPTDIEPSRTNVSLGLPEDEGTALKLLVKGEPQVVDEVRAAELLKNEDLEILVQLNTGPAEADYWFCDFGHEYVTINGDYRT